jgi:DNA mismatch repair protein MutS2
MHDQAFAILEFDLLRALVQRGAQTPMGDARVAALEPFSDLSALETALCAVAECVMLRKRGVRWSFSELADSSEAIARVRIEGNALEPLAILELARLCEAALSARAAVLAERDATPVLWKIVAELPSELHSLVARIRNKILPSGELDDRASPELARLRHEITRLRSSITRSLENLMRRSDEAIQDELVTIRNDRFVIPVKADHRARLQGVAHGFSSSGATVFVEPIETIEANNELQALRETELQEIARILFALSAELRSQLAAVELAASAVAELDFIGAKAVFCESFNCVVPEITGTKTTGAITGTKITGTASVPPASSRAVGNLEFIDARHPLLEENLRSSEGSVVPVTFSLDNQHTTMVISGANAGGKTVVLKTAGLLSLMALSGLPVPARAARVPFYTSVLADIGDHQSLAANLSTFTSHVANIAQMIKLCAAPALVLLDEVGTGTDPEEGSALGVAVVDHFRRACGAHVMATTHYSGLKIYAASDADVLNASVEFDEKTLQPTYRLMVGLAGSSSGLEIARRFGIPDRIVQAAGRQVTAASREAIEYLRRIKRETEEATALRQALEEERKAVAEKFAALDKQADRRERERQTLFQRELEKAVNEFERRSGELVATLQDRSERLKAEREAQRRVSELKREAQRLAGKPRGKESSPTVSAKDAQSRGVRVLREGRVVPGVSAAKEGAAALAREFPRAGLSPEDETYVVAAPRQIAVGDRVRLRSFGSIGIVDQVKGDQFEIRVKSLRFREKLENLELVEAVKLPVEVGRAARLRATRGAEFRPTVSTQPTRSEINLIGQTTDEAVDAVDKFLDQAFLNNLSEIRIIHGHGTGALRRAIGDLLKDHPHVARFAAAPQDQGGSGATVVELEC